MDSHGGTETRRKERENGTKENTEDGTEVTENGQRESFIEDALEKHEREATREAERSSES